MAVAKVAVTSGVYGGSFIMLWLQVGEDVPPVPLMLRPCRPVPVEHAMTAKGRQLRVHVD